MNLIEQHGGYEKAKLHLHNFDEGFGYWCDLNEALLEYRRQHNIFEVGDKVVGLTSKTDEIFQIETTSNKPDRKGEKTYAVTFVGKEGLLVGLQYRHATDKEIKQGYRDNTGK